jgi:hypothetical protein
MNSNDLIREIFHKITPVILSWTADDIYALSLFVYDKSDNPCEPTVTLGYNTEENYQKSIKNASNKLEARWNYAFWPQNQEYIFGIDDTAGIVKQWILNSGLPFFTFHEIFYTDISDTIDDAILDQITQKFVNVLICVVQQLHQTGIIQKKFNKEIPVIIHELEYYDEIAQQNIRANSLCLVQGFIDFIYEI